MAPPVGATRRVRNISMGILKATVRDAVRPAPGVLRLRRDAVAGADGPAPDDTPVPPDNGALTIYRLQKDSGSTPPTASPGSYPADDAGRRASRPAGVVVEAHDALRPGRKDSSGLATGKDRTLERQSDVSGTYASSVFADPVSPVSNVTSAVAHSKPDVSRQMNESSREFDSRKSSSKFRRQESGPDAPSGELHGMAAAAGSTEPPLAAPPQGIAASQPLAPDPAPAAPLLDGLMQAAQATRRRVASADFSRRNGGAEPAAQAAAAEVPSAIAADSRADAELSPTPRAADNARPSTRSPAETDAHRSATSPRETGNPPPVTRQTVIQQGPRLSIGRIEVVVLAPAAAPISAAGMKSEDAAFLSKNYLRRL
jgi:hypothetical protein